VAVSIETMIVDQVATIAMAAAAVVVVKHVVTDATSQATLLETAMRLKRDAIDATRRVIMLKSARTTLSRVRAITAASRVICSVIAPRSRRHLKKLNGLRAGFAIDAIRPAIWLGIAIIIQAMCQSPRTMIGRVITAAKRDTYPEIVPSPDLIERRRMKFAINVINQVTFQRIVPKTNRQNASTAAIWVTSLPNASKNKLLPKKRAGGQLITKKVSFIAGTIQELIKDKKLLLYLKTYIQPPFNFLRKTR
jgi:hypothetical protein